MNRFREPFLVFVHILAAVSTMFGLMVAYNFIDTGKGLSFTIDMVLFAAFLWCVFLYFYLGGKMKVNKISLNAFGGNKSIVSHYAPYSGRYVGVDEESGKILLIALNEPGGEVFGFDYHDWDGYELNDCKLTLKFKNIERPCFTVNSNARIVSFCHKLDVLLSKSYAPLKNEGEAFSKIVQRKLQAA